MLADFINNALIFPWFLVFLRLGTMVMVFPALGDSTVSPRFRLLLAVTMSFVIYPVVYNTLPALPEQSSILVSLMLSEMFIGFLLGIAAKLFITAMNFAGDLISFMSGFQAANLFDPSSNAQTTAPAAFLAQIGVLLILVTGMHLYMIETVVESYRVIPVGEVPPVGDITQAVVQLVDYIFLIGVKLAAPVVVMGFMVYAGFGVLNRLVPQVQAFFVALPLTITLGLLMLGLTLGAMITLFTQELSNVGLLFDQR